MCRTGGSLAVSADARWRPLRAVCTPPSLAWPRCRASAATRFVSTFLDPQRRVPPYRRRFSKLPCRRADPQAWLQRIQAVAESECRSPPCRSCKFSNVDCLWPSVSPLHPPRLQTDHLRPARHARPPGVHRRQQRQGFTTPRCSLQVGCRRRSASSRLRSPRCDRAPTLLP